VKRDLGHAVPAHLAYRGVEPIDRLDNRIGSITREQLDAISASLRAWQDL